MGRTGPGNGTGRRAGMKTGSSVWWGLALLWLLLGVGGCASLDRVAKVNGEPVEEPAPMETPRGEGGEPARGAGMGDGGPSLAEVRPDPPEPDPLPPGPLGTDPEDPDFTEPDLSAMSREELIAYLNSVEPAAGRTSQSSSTPASVQGSSALKV